MQEQDKDLMVVNAQTHSSSVVSSEVDMVNKSTWSSQYRTQTEVLCCIR